jgi:hypothetical protein
MIKKSIREKYPGTLTLLVYVVLTAIFLVGMSFYLPSIGQGNQLLEFQIVITISLTVFITILLYLFKFELKN